MRYKEFSQTAMDNLEFICCMTDVESNKLLYLNRTARELFGIGEDEFLNKRCHDVFYDCEGICVTCDVKQLELGKCVTTQKRIAKTGKDYSIQSTLIKIDGRLAKLTVAFDVTQLLGELDQLESQLSLEETLLACIQTFMQDDDVDRAIVNLLEIIGHYFDAERASLFEVDEQSGFAYHRYEWVVSQEYSMAKLHPKIGIENLSGVFKAFREDGEFLITDVDSQVDHTGDLYKIFKTAGCVAVIAVPLLKDGQIRSFIGIDNPKINQRDIALLHSVGLFINEELKKRRFIEQLAFLSYTDSLTGIYNRNKYVERVAEIEASPPKRLGVVHVDSNSLKKINELYGAEHGDNMLKQLATLLQEFFPSDVYRVAGDEFIAFCPEIEQEAFEQLIQVLRKDHSHNPDRPFAVGGIWQMGRINIPLAVKQSGELMLAEKQNYYKSLAPDTLEYNSNSGEVVLKEIRDGMYDIYLQPKVDLKSGEIAGAEALIRKFDANGKMIPPDKFVPIYEHEGTIRYIDFFVLERVCQVIQRLIEEGRPVKIGVNFSRVTFMNYDLLDEIVSICDRYNIPHEYIKIEITESIDKMDLDFFIKKLSAIYDAGFDISLDDFGAKHSNLMMLIRGEFTEVKIDKGLIDNIAISTHNRTIIRNVIKLINELGSSVCVAEGIESKEQVKILQEQGCSYGQGYYFYRPLPVPAFFEACDKNEHKGILKLEDISRERLENFKVPSDIAAAVVDNLPLGLNIWNYKQETVFCNDKVLELFDIGSHEEYLTEFFKLSPERQPSGELTSEKVLYHLNEVRYKGVSQFNWMHCKLNGEEIPAEIILKTMNIKDEDGEALVVGFTRDLRPDLEKGEYGEGVCHYFYKDIPSHLLLDRFADMSKVLTFVFNHRNKTVQFYGELTALLGVSKGKMPFPETAIFKEFVHPDDLHMLANLDEKESMVNLPVRVIIEGQEKICLLSYELFWDENGMKHFAVGKVTGF